MAGAPEVVNAYVSGGDLVLLRRDSEGRLDRRTTKAEYVAYLRAEEVDRDLGRQLSTSKFVRSYKVQPDGWIRIGFVDRLLRDDMVRGRRAKAGDENRSPLLDRGVRAYEGDVGPVRRWLTDSGASIQPPRRSYLDLETDSRVPFSRKVEARILSWAIVAPDGRQWSGVLREDSHAAERDMLLEMWAALEPFDQVLAWNGDRFDFEMVDARSDGLRLEVDVERWLWLDQMELFREMNKHAAESGDEKQSMALNAIATALLGEGKHEFDASKTWEAWEAGGERREEMRLYMVQDTDLLRRIEEKTGFAGLHDTICQLCNVFPNTRGLDATVLMDGYLLRAGLERGLHFATKTYRDKSDTEKFKGAHVMEPRAKGVEGGVHVCDFAGQYPSIMLSLNMSPETVANDVPVNGPIPEGRCRSPATGMAFDVTITDAIVPAAIKHLMKERKRHKERKKALPPGSDGWVEADRLNNAAKVVINSFYGGIGSPYSRFFDRRLAETVTQTAKWFILATQSAAEQRGWRVIYIDTDSLYVVGPTRAEFAAFVQWCNAELYPPMVSKIGCRENHVLLEYEKEFLRIVFVSAKRYAGQYAFYGGVTADPTSKPEVKGLEFKRGDTSQLARKLQEFVIEEVVRKGDVRPAVCRAHVDAARAHVLNDPLPIEEVVLSKSISKPLREYVVKQKSDGTAAAQPPHVRVAKMLAERGADVGEGTRVAYVVTDGDGGIKGLQPAADYEGKPDRYYLWESLVYPPTQRLLKAAFPDQDWETGLEKVRPPKLRGKALKATQAGQGTLFDANVAPGPRSPGTGVVEGHTHPGAGSLPPPMVSEEPFVLVVHERLGGCLERLALVCAAHPGPRPLVVRIVLADGAEATLAATERTVSGDERMAAELEGMLWEEAATVEWEARCAS